jgi:gas vesicle protein
MMTSRPASPSSDKIVLALIGGVALGAIVMALVTPKTGRQLRATLKTAARRLAGRIEDLDDDPIEALFI